MPGLDWLTARPIAHRGLHDAANNIVENTASAFAAAIAGNYGIECDLQISADGEAMVHHDDTLGPLDRRRRRARGDERGGHQARRHSRATSDRIMTLGEFCDLVAGRVALVIEMKSHFAATRACPPGSPRCCRAMPVRSRPCRSIPARSSRCRMPRPACRAGSWPKAVTIIRNGTRSAAGRNTSWRISCTASGPGRISSPMACKDLPAIAPLLARFVFGLPLLTWTVRSEADRKRARR